MGFPYLMAHGSVEDQQDLLRQYLRGTVMDLSGRQFSKIPDAVYAFPELTELDISDNPIRSIPTKIKTLQQLTTLRARDCKLKKISPALAKLTRLRTLDLHDSEIDFGAHGFLFEMTGLRDLDISDSDTKSTLPPSFFAMRHLRRLCLHSKNHWSGFANYPSVTVLEGDPVEVDPLPVARGALANGRWQVARYLLTDGTSDDRILGMQVFYREEKKAIVFVRTPVTSLPEELPVLDVEQITIEDTKIPVRDSFRDDGAEELPLEEVVAEELRRTAALSRLPRLRTLTVAQSGLRAFAPLSAARDFETLIVENAHLAHFDLDLPNPASLKRIELRRLSYYPCPSATVLRQLAAALPTYTGLELLRLDCSSDEEDVLAALEAVKAAVGEGVVRRGSWGREHYN